MNVRIIHADHLIKVDPSGTVDFEAGKRTMVETASLSASLTDFEIILDFRKTCSSLTVTDLWYLAAELSNFRTAYACWKTVILCPLEEFNHAAFFALCAQNRGFNVQAFDSLEGALKWLSADRTETL